jgi:hypothetical protein
MSFLCVELTMLTSVSVSKLNVLRFGFRKRSFLPRIEPLFTRPDERRILRHCICTLTCTIYTIVMNVFPMHCPARDCFRVRGEGSKFDNADAHVILPSVRVYTSQRSFLGMWNGASGDVFAFRWRTYRTLLQYVVYYPFNLCACMVRRHMFVCLANRLISFCS